MKKFAWLAFYGWPALAIIILFSLFAGLFFLLAPGTRKVSAGPSVKGAAVRYAATDNNEPCSSEEQAEMRALYASDLFASSRSSQFPALQIATDCLYQTNVVPYATPLFLPFTPSSNEVHAHLSAINAINMFGADIDADHPSYSSRPCKQSNQRQIRTPKLSVELKGGLSHLTVPPAFLQDISPALPAVLRPALQAGLPADRKARSLRAQMRVNRQGGVDYVLAEDADCEPSACQDIVKRIYQCRFNNVTQACEGTILISYSAYSAADSNSQANAQP